MNSFMRVLLYRNSIFSQGTVWPKSNRMSWEQGFLISRKYRLSFSNRRHSQCCTCKAFSHFQSFVAEIDRVQRQQQFHFCSLLTEQFSRTSVCLDPKHSGFAVPFQQSHAFFFFADPFNDSQAPLIAARFNSKQIEAVFIVISAETGKSIFLKRRSIDKHLLTERFLTLPSEKKACFPNL